MRKIIKSYILLFFLLSSLFTGLFITIPDNSVYAIGEWTIEGDTVYIDDAKVYASATPHTLYGSGDVIFEVKSKVYSGDVDFIWGFNQEVMKPTGIWIWNGADWIQWNAEYTKIKKDFQGMDTWYVYPSRNVVAGTTYKCRIHLEQQQTYAVGGKYWFAFKPSSETLNQAIANNHLYALDPWYNLSWGYYIPMTIDHTKFGHTLQDYPLLVNITNLNLKDHAQLDGDDIIFVNQANTTKFAHVFEHYNSTTGKLVAWVNIPYISNTTDTQFNMYYGKPSSTNQQASDTFNTEFKTVLLGNDTSTSGINDFSQTANDYIKMGANQPTLNETGSLIGWSQRYDGVNDYAKGTDIPSYTIVSGTISFWFKLDFYSATGNYPLIYTMGAVSANGDWFCRLASGTLTFGIKSGGAWVQATGTTSWAKNCWYLVTLRFNAVGTYLYLNTTLTDTKVATGGFNSDDDVYLMVNHPDDTSYTNGTMDDFRIMSVMQNYSWISAVYNTSVGNVVSSSGEVTSNFPDVDTVSVTNIEENTATLTGILNYDGNQSACTVRFEYGKTTSFGTNTSNQTAHKGDTFTADISSLTAGQLYFARAFANSTTENGTGDTFSFMTKPNASTLFSYAIINSTHANLSWVKGEGSNASVLVSNATAQPTDVTMGTTVYNGTLNYTHIAISFSTITYYSLWEYGNWSYGTTEYWRFSDTYFANATGGGIIIAVYDELTLLNITHWNVSIMNVTGTTVYNAWNCINYHNISVSSLGFTGDAYILISAGNYSSRLFTATITSTSVYVLHAYLAPANGTELYLIRIYNEVNQLIENVTVDIKFYSNTSGIYELVTSIVTDSVGECQVWLVPNTLYKVFLSKTSYITTVDDYIPDAVYYGFNYPKSFKIYTTEVSYYNETFFIDVIEFSGWINTATAVLRVNYTDDICYTVNTMIYVYQFNTTTNLSTLVGTNLNTTECLVQYNLTDMNTTVCYQVVLYLNHSVFGYQTLTLWICGDLEHIGITTPAKFNLLFTLIFGYSPGGIGWTNIFGFFIVIACMFSFGERDAGIGALLCGFLLLFLNSVIGLSVFGIIIPVLFIIIGALIEWRIRLIMGGG